MASHGSGGRCRGDAVELGTADEHEHDPHKLSGRRDVDIIYTGLRPGEKMSEELFTPGESIRQTAHPLVSSVDVPSLEASVIEGTNHPSPVAATAWMRRAAIPRSDVVKLLDESGTVRAV